MLKNSLLECDRIIVCVRRVVFEKRIDLENLITETCYTQFRGNRSFVYVDL